MLYFTYEKKNCMGCGACFAACPKKCIDMKKDEEGFFYPDADLSQCIHCNLCETVCPIKNKEKRNRLVKNQEAYAALSNDYNIWKRSASGGAFSEICKAFGDEQTIVCGSRWEGLYAAHCCVIGVDNIASLCKSKYIASDLKDTFLEIKRFLLDGKSVVFCGTPCQIAGLKSFLGKEYPKLLLIDLICHGVGSPEVFLECIHNMEKEFGGKILEYEFRAKRKNWEKDYLQKVVCVEKSIYVVDDPYIQLFLSQKCLRPSCGENCKFRNSNREGDITIADFKGLGNVFPELAGSKKNYSTIVFNSDKGKKLISTIDKAMDMRKCSIKDIARFNPLFCKQTWFCNKRNDFFDDFLCNREEAIKNHTQSARIYNPSFIRKVWGILPTSLRRIIYQKRGNRL